MNKRIVIDDTYCIDIEDLNWILKKLVVTADTLKSGIPAKNAGKPHEVIIGYFSSLKSALEHYVNSIEKDEVSKALEPVSIGNLETILLRIEKVCKGLKLVETEE